MVGCCECGNEPLVFIEYEKFPDKLRTYEILRKTSAPWNKSVRPMLTSFFPWNENLCFIYKTNICACPIYDLQCLSLLHVSSLQRDHQGV